MFVLVTTITSTVDAVDPITRSLRLYTGVVNELGKELPIVISFDNILELSGAELNANIANDIE